ncbi:MAG: uncharacterized protein JWN04_2805 [Myxococcaceae bacterium]|nr:uncharacterized protein [Myxococcaceae bacterium]
MIPDSSPLEPPLQPACSRSRAGPYALWHVPAFLQTRMTVFFCSARMPWYVALVALLVGLPTLGVGTMLDDHYLRVTMLRDAAYDGATQSPLEAFRLFDGDPIRTLRMVDRGLAVWWTDSHVRLAFFRPLSAATHLFDFSLAGGVPWWMHLHSVLYYALTSCMAALVFRRVLGQSRAAGFAALLFAIDGTHGMVVGWIANRNQLVAAVFALASFAAFARPRAPAPRGAANVLLGPTLLALAFCAGEAAVAILAYFAAYTLVLDTRPKKQRLLTLAPYLVVTLAWGLFYSARGYGTSASDFYHDPLRDPVAYAVAAAQHMPILAMSELVGLPADLFVMLSAQARACFVVLASGLAVVVGCILWPTLQQDREARFFGIAGLLALLPVCATAPSARLLLLPSVGFLGLGVRFLSRMHSDGHPMPRLARAYAGYFLLLHLALAVPGFQVMAQQLGLLANHIERLAQGLDGERELPGARVLIVNAPDGAFMSFVGLLRHVTHRPAPRAITPLALGTRGVTLARTGERSLRVRQDGGIALQPTERMTCQVSNKWKVGARVRLSDLTVEIIELTSDGRPRTVDFIFDRPLDDPSLRFTEWNGDTLVPFVVPGLGKWRRIEGQDVLHALTASADRPRR